MSYQINIWNKGDTITADKLNNIENGVSENATSISEQAAQIGYNAEGISQLSEDFVNISNVIYTKPRSIDAVYVIGGIGSSGIANDKNNRVRINNFIFAKSGSKISVDDGYKFNIALYSSADSGAMTAYRGFATDSYVLETDAYFRASIATTDDAVQSDTSIGAHFCVRYYHQIYCG